MVFSFHGLRILFEFFFTFAQQLFNIIIVAEFYIQYICRIGAELIQAANQGNNLLLVQILQLLFHMGIFFGANITPRSGHVRFDM